MQAAIGHPERVKLKFDDFRLLRQSGVFAGYSKAELLEGELWIEAATIAGLTVATEGLV